MNSQEILNAIKKAECLEIDYSGMSEDEVNELDNAVDTIFLAAKKYARVLAEVDNV